MKKRFQRYLKLRTLKSARRAYKAQKQGFRHVLLKAILGSLFVRILQAVSGLLITVIIARSIGAQGFGAYSAILALVSIAHVPVQSGIASLLGRQMVQVRLLQNWPLFRGIMVWSGIITAAYSLLIVVPVVFAVSAKEITGSINPWLFGLCFIILAIGRMLSGYQKGMMNVVTAQSHDMIKNFIVLATLLPFYFYADSFTTSYAISTFMISSATVAVIMLWFSYRSTPAAVFESREMKFEMPVWTKATVTFVLISGIMKVTDNSGVLLTNYFGNATEAGIFQIAFSHAVLMLFGLDAILTVVAPYFTQFHAKGNQQKLQYLVTLAAKITFGFSFVMAVICIFFGKDMLTYLYGEQFAQGHIILVLVALAYMVKASTGASIALLSATGNEIKMLKIATFATVVNFGASALLVPHFGSMGSAIAFLFYMVVISLGTWLTCIRLLDIDTFFIRSAPPKKMLELPKP